jgi:hypothetical protein
MLPHQKTANFRIGNSVVITAGISNVGEVVIIEDIWHKEKCLVVVYPNGDVGTKHFEDVDLAIFLIYLGLRVFPSYFLFKSRYCVFTITLL